MTNLATFLLEGFLPVPVYFLNIFTPGHAGLHDTHDKGGMWPNSILLEQDPSDRYLQRCPQLWLEPAWSPPPLSALSPSPDPPALPARAPGSHSLNGDGECHKPLPLASSSLYLTSSTLVLELVGCCAILQAPPGYTVCT